MKVNSMRLLDRWVGSVISAVLTVVRKVTDLFRRMPEDPPRRILIVKLVEQGATVVAEPALRRVVEMVGRDKVFMAVFAENRFILDVLDLMPRENVITIRSDGLVTVFVDTIRAIWRMRRERIDSAVDFEFFSRYSGALTYLSGARRRVGLHSFAGDGLPAAGRAGSVRLRRRRRGNPRGRVVAEKPRWARIDTPLVLLNANAGDLLPLRRWASECYVELAKRLLRKYP